MLTFSSLPYHLRPIARRAVGIALGGVLMPTVLWLTGYLGVKGVLLFLVCEVLLTMYSTVVLWNPTMSYLIMGTSGPSGVEKTCGGQLAWKLENYTQEDWNALVEAGGSRTIDSGTFYEECVVYAKHPVPAPGPSLHTSVSILFLSSPRLPSLAIHLAYSLIPPPFSILNINSPPSPPSPPSLTTNNLQT